LAAGTRRAAEITAAAAEDARVLDNTSDLEALLNKLSETIKLPAEYASGLNSIDAAAAAATTAEEGSVVANASEDYSTGALGVDDSIAAGFAMLYTTFKTSLTGCDEMEVTEKVTCATTAVMVFLAGVSQWNTALLGLFLQANFT
jgi:hypothetical protein